MIKNVADAIRAKINADPDLADWANEKAVQEAARAAIEAMRKPTEFMIQETRRREPYDRDCAEVWPDMIDAALAEK